MNDEPEVVAVFDEETGKMKYVSRTDVDVQTAIEDSIINQMALWGPMYISGVHPELDNSVAEYTPLPLREAHMKVYRNVVYVQIFDVWFALGQLERVYDYDVLEVLKK